MLTRRVIRAIRRRAGWLITGLIGALATNVGPVVAQRPTGAAAAKPPAFKGIWEPVSYSEDLDLTDVVFVTTEIGWATGEGGTIIHTRDGGATWNAVLGGDPQSRDRKIDQLQFIDEHHGWAVQDKKLFRTGDGKHWEEYGTTPLNMGPYAFLSSRVGVAAAGVSAQGAPDHVFRTTDGGRTWKMIAPCTIKVTIDGLNRTVQCQIDRFHFPTPQVGYLIGYLECVGMGCGGPPVVGKTVDGGQSWQFLLGPGDVKLTRLKDVFFTDENNGVVVTWGDHKVYQTSDGAATWRGLIATPGEWTRFADPEVGWSFGEQHLSYSTDGGQRWSSRPHRFPAHPRAFSFPRRDRAYVVGDHGMVFRYRIVPADEPTKPEVLLAPAMPGFASPVDEEVARVEGLLTELRTAVEKAPGPAAAAPVPNASAPAADSSAPPTAEDVIAVAPSPFTQTCCGAPVNKLGLAIQAIAASLPTFLAKYKNTNLLIAGLRMVTDLPGRFGDLRLALKAFKTAPDQSAAQAAIAQIGTAATALQLATKAAFQTAVPPVEPQSDAPSQVEAAAQQVPAAAANAVETKTDSAGSTVKQEGAKKVKKGLGGLIKKVRIP